VKALFGQWAEMKASDLNRILKPHGVKLVVKKSKEWGTQVNVTAHKVVVPVRRARAVKAADGGLLASGAGVVLGADPGKPQ